MDILPTSRVARATRHFWRPEVAAGRGAYVVRDVAGKSHALFELNIRGELMCIVAMNEDGSIAVIRNM